MSLPLSLRYRISLDLRVRLLGVVSVDLSLQFRINFLSPFDFSEHLSFFLFKRPLPRQAHGLRVRKSLGLVLRHAVLNRIFVRVFRVLLELRYSIVLGVHLSFHFFPCLFDFLFPFLHLLDLLFLLDLLLVDLVQNVGHSPP